MWAPSPWPMQIVDWDWWIPEVYRYSTLHEIMFKTCKYFLSHNSLYIQIRKHTICISPFIIIPTLTVLNAASGYSESISQNVLASLYDISLCRIPLSPPPLVGSLDSPIHRNSNDCRNYVIYHLNFIFHINISRNEYDCWYLANSFLGLRYKQFPMDLPNLPNLRYRWSFYGLKAIC